VGLLYGVRRDNSHDKPLAGLSFSENSGTIGKIARRFLTPSLVFQEHCGLKDAIRNAANQHRGLGALTCSTEQQVSACVR